MPAALARRIGLWNCLGFWRWSAASVTAVAAGPAFYIALVPRPEALGVVPANGQLEIGALPEALEDGATLAISIEPKAGSPTGLPTGPVIFVGRLNAVRP